MAVRPKTQGKKRKAAPRMEALSLLSSLDKVGDVCRKDEGGTEDVELDAVVEGVVKLAQLLSGKVFYQYQKRFSARIIEILLMHEGESLTGLWSRQSGKTEVLSSTLAAIAIMFPALAEQFPTDWRFNITDELGRYRGYRDGVSIGVYAPILEQSQIMFERLRNTLSSGEAEEVMEELGVTMSANRGNTVKLTNGSTLLAMSASKNSQIEGHTHHLVVAEEAQDIDAQKMRKSIHPMVASTQGNIVKIGTANATKGDFYQAIKINRRLEQVTGKQYHFHNPWHEVVKYNSMYARYIEQEKIRIGEFSDEFRMSYGCEFILERGMFVTDKTLMASGVPQVVGRYSEMYRTGFTGKNIVVGIDLAKENDSTVVCVMDVDWSAPSVYEEAEIDFMDSAFVAYEKHVLAWFEFLGDDYEEQFHRIVDICRQFRPIRKVCLDATREASFADRIRHHPLFHEAEITDFVFGRQTKSEGYRLFHNDISAGRFHFPAGDAARSTTEYRRFVLQMLDLTKTYKDGYLCVEHPDEAGAHDDYPDATMLATWAADEPTADLAIENLENFLTA